MSSAITSTVLLELTVGAQWASILVTLRGKNGQKSRQKFGLKVSESLGLKLAKVWA